MNERLSIWKAVNFLIENIDKIKTVSEWSEICGYSKTYFLRKMQGNYGVSPDVMLRSIRLMKIVEELHQNPQKISYAIARDVGLNNDNSLCYFVRRYFGITPKKLKKRVRNYSSYVKMINDICNENNIPINSHVFEKSIEETKRLVA